MSKYFRHRKFCKFTAGASGVDYKGSRDAARLRHRNRQDRAEPDHGTKARYQRQLSTAVKRARFLACCPTLTSFET
jgi:small subunit ribosomal protein S18